MGKKRIATIDLSQEEKKPRSTKASRDKGKKSGSPGKTDHGPAKPGKQHGRITDMGAVMLEEMEKEKKPPPERLCQLRRLKRRRKRKKLKKQFQPKESVRKDIKLLRNSSSP